MSLSSAAWAVNAWQPTSGPQGGSVSALAIDPATPATVYAGTEFMGVSKSTDGGATWAVANSGLPNTRVSSLAIDLATPATLYASTSAGVAKSTDGGATWALAGSGLQGYSVYSLAMAPGAATLYAAGTESVWHGNGFHAEGRVFRSQDAGATWAIFMNGLTGTQGVQTLAIDPATPTTLYAGTDSGAFKSINGGVSWSSSSAGLNNNNVLSLAMNPATPATLYAGTAGGGVFKTTDGGANWSAANTGLASLYVLSLAIDPATPTTLYAGTVGGVFKSTNGGTTWSAAHSGLANAIVQALAIDPATPTTLYAGTNGSSVFKSTNGAASNESRLLDLVLDAGSGPVALSPAFDTNQFTYHTLTVQAASIAVTPTAWASDAAILVNGVPVASGSASAQIPLNPGSNTLSVSITSADDMSTRSFTITVAQAQTPSVCSFNGASLSEGQSVTAYKWSAVPTGQVCVSEQRQCVGGGLLTGAYAYASCGVNVPSSCLFNGLTIGHSQSVTAYQSSNVPFGSSCTSQARTCTSGSLSGSYNYASCTAGAPASCLFNGQLIGHGQNVTAYMSASTPAGGSCVSESRACTNGSLSGSYNFDACQATPQNTQTITFGPLPNRSFGATVPPLSASATSTLTVGFASSTPAVCTVAGTTVTLVAAGTCTVTATQPGDTTWAAAPPVPQSFTVNAVAPGAPTNVQATPSGSGQVTVSFTPPASDGGGITQYTVTALANGQPSGQTCAATPPVTSCTVTGLQDGTTYTFSVAATNGGGSGVAPVPTNPATPLADSKAFSAPSSTGSGPVAVAVSGGGATCAFESVRLLSAASAGAPAGPSFPHGVLDFVLNGCDTSPVTVDITYPGTLAQGAQYWKRQGGAWGPFAGAALAVNKAVLTLVDGGAGDDEGGAPNGRIVDPGGVAVLAAPGPGGAAAIPTLGEWGLVLLAALLGLLAWRRRV
ncbi:hypothetical protein GmRootA79_41860 [Acidovorax sp. A79]|uniref:IPTL-CTERM sorting domain-containing protein n=1 Tax=Acidovorax sp. A79 TaxID=3056107 RepID=UPI0034E8B705